MTIERVALADVEALVASGDLADAKTIVGLPARPQHALSARRAAPPAADPGR